MFAHPTGNDLVYSSNPELWFICSALAIYGTVTLVLIAYNYLK